MKYYFITYQVVYLKSGSEMLSNTVSKKHPIDWLIEASGREPNEVYTLLWWKEITEEDYKKMEIL